MKLVIDNNVLVSGTLWDGPSARLLTAILAGHAQMFVSEPLLAELLDVLRRPKFAERITRRHESPESIVARFRAGCFETSPVALAQPEELRDPDDVHVLACALAANADVIVSGDKDLLSLGSFQGIPILTPRKRSEGLNSRINKDE